MSWPLASGAALLLAAANARAQSPDAGPSDCRTVRCEEQPQSTGDDSLWLLLARAPLAPVRLAFRTTTELLSIVPTIEDEHHVKGRLEDVFFDDERTFGAYPTAFYETGLEPNAGVRLVHRDLFGRRERLQVRAGFGGVHNQIYESELRSGKRWAPLELSLQGLFRWREGYHFYGIGNADLATGTPLDPVAPWDAAIKSEYGEQQVRALGTASLHLGPIGLALAQLWRGRALSPTTDDEPPVERVYAGESVAVFDRTLVDLYDELRVSWDARNAEHPRLPDELPSSGTKLTVWTGAQHELASPQLSFGRVGLDLLPAIDLYRGDRVLRLRVRSAWVIGPLQRIPFLDLPELGGASLLRGYDGDRFRGRGTVLVSAEYRYPVQQNLSGFLFVDAGRAYLRLTQVSASSIRGARLGFGGGIYAFTTSALLFRAQLASSIDGGLFVALKMDIGDDLGDTY